MKNFKETFLKKYNCVKAYLKENSGFLITVLLIFIALMIFIKVITDMKKARELKKIRYQMEYSGYDGMEYDEDFADYLPYDEGC
jgi:hypothetical protein